jgi:formylmethanofuran dehydrogenase subunit C
MTTLTLKLRGALERSLDLTPLNPAAIVGRSADAIAKMRLNYGAKRMALGDCFAITGGGAAGAVELCLRGITPHCHRIGRGLEDGSIEVTGTAGDELGREMRGGRITVTGNAGDGVGAGMTGGRIALTGSAGDCLGGLVPGATRGMNDGVIHVGRAVGDRAGERMRRGLILVGGDAGAQTGARMIAGTIVVLGTCGPQVGFGMRRGSVLLAETPVAMTPTFNDCGEFELAIMAILQDYIGSLHRNVARKLDGFKRVRRWCGDMAYGGRGELFIATRA